jgi:hypothetical protein
MVSSLIGCNHTGPFMYKEELKDNNSVIAKDGSTIQVYSDRYTHKANSISKTSPLYTETDCKEKAQSDYLETQQVLKNDGGEFSINQYTNKFQNENFNIYFKNCFKSAEVDKYQYQLNVELRDAPEYYNKYSIDRGPWAIITLPVIFVMMVVVIVPVFMYYIIKSWIK